VFVCRYGFAIYSLSLRGRDVTYGDIGEKGRPFQALITESEEFDFDGEDIVRIRGELATLLDNLSALYKEWKKANDELEKKAEEEESKKPAACRLLLESGNTLARVEEGQDMLMTEDHGGPPTSSEDFAAEEQHETSKPSPSLQSKPIDVEMTDPSRVAVATELEETSKPASRLQSKVLEVETAEPYMMDAEKAEDDTCEATWTAVKVEEDQYGVEATEDNQDGSEDMELDQQALEVEHCTEEKADDQCASEAKEHSDGDKIMVYHYDIADI